MDEQKERQKEEPPKSAAAQSKRKVLVVIDGPNALGKDFSDRLDLEQVRDYAYALDKTAQLYYLTKIHDYPISKREISKLGYKILESHKDIDYLVREEIQEKLKAQDPPNILLLGTKDHDVLEFIKGIKAAHDVKVVLTISSEEGLAKALIPVVDDIQYFPERVTGGMSVVVTKRTEQGTYMARHHDGRIIFINSPEDLRNGEEVHIQITGQNPSKTIYFASLLERRETP
jgi:hypothetical protein